MNDLDFLLTTVMPGEYLKSHIFTIISAIRDQIPVGTKRADVIRATCYYDDYDLLLQVVSLFGVDFGDGKGLMLQGMIHTHAYEAFDRFFDHNREMFTADFCERALGHCFTYGATHIIKKLFSLHRDHLLTRRDHLESFFRAATCPYNDENGHLMIKDHVHTVRLLFDFCRGLNVKEYVRLCFERCCQSQAIQVFDYLLENHQDILSSDIPFLKKVREDPLSRMDEGMKEKFEAFYRSALNKKSNRW